MSEILARIGSDPAEAVATFLAAINEYQSLDALTRGQSEEEAKLQGFTAAISKVRDEALAQGWRKLGGKPKRTSMPSSGRALNMPS